MKERSIGFLNEKNIDQNDEVFDYVQELHEYLWRFVRCEFPFAEGELKKWLDVAIEMREYKIKSIKGGD
jgi:hypothetical protein